MGQLAEYRCPRCGYKTIAPVNTTGRYAVRMGTIQIFVDLARKELFSELISRRYFDEEKHRDPIAELLSKNRSLYGDTLEDYPLSMQPGEDKSLAEHELHLVASNKNKPWNAITCGCPKCHKKMTQATHEIIMVD